jgi:hypothetical protein
MKPLRKNLGHKLYDSLSARLSIPTHKGGGGSLDILCTETRI